MLQIAARWPGAPLLHLKYTAVDLFNEITIATVWADDLYRWRLCQTLGRL